MLPDEEICAFLLLDEVELSLLDDSIRLLTRAAPNDSLERVSRWRLEPDGKWEPMDFLRGLLLLSSGLFAKRNRCNWSESTTLAAQPTLLLTLLLLLLLSRDASDAVAGLLSSYASMSY